MIEGRVCVDVPAFGTSFLSLLVATALLVGCAEESKEPAVAPMDTGELAAGVVARVGGEFIVADEVARIAAAQGVGVALARDLAIRDALVAEQARVEGVDADPPMQIMINAALGRRMLRKLLDDADRAGPVTDEELERVMQRRWLDLDRPEGFRVVHAVVRVKAGADDVARGRAEAVARALREAVLPVAEMAKSMVSRDQPDPAVGAFKRLAEAVPRDGFEVKVEELPPIAADGRLMTPEGGAVEKPFAEGASKLDGRGAFSDIISTSYGFHVLLLLERIPEALVSLEERRLRVREEVLWMRASVARAKLLDRLRPDVLVGRDVDTLLVMVPVDR